MAVVRVYSSKGVKELQCFDTLTDVPYLEDNEEVEELEDDGELTVGLPIE